MTKITVEGILPDELLRAFLQHLRDFDLEHDLMHDGKIDLTIGTVAAIFQSIHPPFEHRYVFPQGKSTDHSSS